MILQSLVNDNVSSRTEWIADANADATQHPYVPESSPEMFRYEILVDGVETLQTLHRKITKREV